MWDFLTFKRFIAQDILILMYYVGAVLMPIALWYFRGYLHKFFTPITQSDTAFGQLFSSLNIRNRTFILLGFLMLFLCMEICWRMMFELMIGYFDMHDDLHRIVQIQGLE
jgi:hypothetical protein